MNTNSRSTSNCLFCKGKGFRKAKVSLLFGLINTYKEETCDGCRGTGVVLADLPKQDVSELENPQYKYDYLKAYRTRIYSAVNYNGADDHEDVISILQEAVTQALQTQKAELLDWVEREVVGEDYADGKNVGYQRIIDFQNEQRQTINNKRSEKL